MEKKFMNKMDVMELDMVAGGAIKGGPADSDSAFSSLGRAMNNAVVDGGKAVVNGVKAVGSAFGRFFRMVRVRSV